MTRMNVLRDFYQQETGNPLPEGVGAVMLSLLPSATDRELQGALIRVVAYASLTNQTISPSLAWDVLNGATVGQVEH
jgi:hypothetical protein